MCDFIVGINCNRSFDPLHGPCSSLKPDYYVAYAYLADKWMIYLVTQWNFHYNIFKSIKKLAAKLQSHLKSSRFNRKLHNQEFCIRGKFLLHIVDFSGHQGLKVQIAVSMQLQRALHDPSWGIRVLSSETIAHFLNEIKIILFLTTNARLALTLHLWLHAWCSPHWKGHAVS